MTKNLGLKLFLMLSLFSIIILPISFEDADALRQVAGKIELDIKPGQNASFEWGLASDEKIKMTTVELSAQGDGSEFLSFPKSVDIEPLMFEYIVVDVNIPEDYPGGITLEPLLFATEYGEGGSATQINIKMIKIATLNIALNDDSSLWVDWDKLKPQVEQTQQKEPAPELIDPEPVEEKPKGGLVITGDSDEPKCGPGTEAVDGICKIIKNEESGGGCLIATATYGSELAPQVQTLRELRDNKLMHTESGSSFISGFNSLYYSFSPTIADYERENPLFKEAVKLAITPIISSLSILNNVDMNTETEVLGYGVSLILLNAAMYVGTPIAAVILFRTTKAKL